MLNCFVAVEQGWSITATFMGPNITSAPLIGETEFLGQGGQDKTVLKLLDNKVEQKYSLLVCLNVYDSVVFNGCISQSLGLAGRRLLCGPRSE